MDALALPAGAVLTATSLALPPGLPFDEWRAIGVKLCRTERSALWGIGDWWAFGEHRYGERAKMVRDDEWDGLAYQTFRNAAVVAAAFDVYRRRDNLTFKHHAEVAALPPADADRLLDAAAEKNWSTRVLRAEAAKLRNAAAIGAPPADGTRAFRSLEELMRSGRRYGCIYADPPWLYGNQATRAATSNHYDGLTVDQICALPVRDLAADDAHLHLWTTNGFLFECPRIFDAWGFEFRSSLVWVKPQIGIGNYWRNAHEFLLTAVRGDATRFNDRTLRSWVECDRGRHSAKPEQVRHMIERASPGPRLEMFARLDVTDWDTWGDQVGEDLFSSGRPLEREAAA